MSILAIIPARQGSKRVPNKAIRECGGKPLISWTLEAAHESQKITSVLVSSDCDGVMSLAKRYENFQRHTRKEGLATDEALMFDVVKDILLSSESRRNFDAICLLQPTSPLRTSEDIDAAIVKFNTCGCDTLVSYTNVSNRAMPQKLMQLNDQNKLAFNPAIKLDASNLVLRNGPAIIISSVETVLGGGFYGPHIQGFFMDECRSVDIDTEFDFKVADLLLKNRLALDSDR